MTKEKALTLLAELVGDDPDYAPALEALRPKARKAKTGAVSPAVREILRNLKRPDEPFWGRVDIGQEAAYLDTFGGYASPEREAQAARIRTLNNGPSAEAFGKPESVAWVAASAGYNWQDEDKRRAALRVLVDAWRYTEQGQAFEQAKAAHEARKAQFAYAPPKTRKDDERRTFALAVLASTTIETESTLAAVDWTAEAVAA